MSGGNLAMEPLDQRGGYHPQQRRTSANSGASGSPTRSPTRTIAGTQPMHIPGTSPGYMVNSVPNMAASPTSPTRPYMDMGASNLRTSTGSIPKSGYPGLSPTRSVGSLEGEMYLEPTNNNNMASLSRNKPPGYISKPTHDSGKWLYTFYYHHIY